MTYIKNTEKDHSMNTPNQEQTSSRPIRPSFWLRAIEHRKHQLTREYRATLGDTAREGISDEDYATTMATLEKMAHNLGWSEDQRPEYRPDRAWGRGARHPGMMRGRGFGPGHGRGFRPGPDGTISDPNTTGRATTEA